MGHPDQLLKSRTAATSWRAAATSASGRVGSGLVEARRRLRQERRHSGPEPTQHDLSVEVTDQAEPERGTQDHCAVPVQAHRLGTGEVEARTLEHHALRHGKMALCGAGAKPRAIRCRTRRLHPRVDAEQRGTSLA